MSDTFAQILALVSQGDYFLSNHAYDELLNDRISANDLLQGLATAEMIEDYPDAGRGPSV